jgi:hypothetical protein
VSQLLGVTVLAADVSMLGKWVEVRNAL